MFTTDSNLVPETHNLLITLSDLGSKPDYSEEQRMTLRQALLLLKTHADYQIFGVCADSLEQGIKALQEYTQAFEYTLDPVSNTQEGSVYIKFNPNRNLFHVAPYSGEFTGVLISYQSEDGGGYEGHEGHNGTYGHFPLDLFH
jgi:Domain of unknown function (DUF1824)